MNTRRTGIRHHFQKMTNSTMVTEFLLMGFVDKGEIRFLHTMLFLLMYLSTLLGNLLIVSATTLYQNLHTPMYFFLRNMSILDMCFISVTVPNACVNSFTRNRTISLAGCATQLFLLIYCACVELLFLTVMAHGRSGAICQPLLYPVIMNQRFCVWATLFSLLSGLIYAAVHTGNTFRLSFCRSDVIYQFFCDIPPLLSNSCSDTFNSILLLIVSDIVFCGGCFFFITMSYFHIFSTVQKFPTRERGKAFSTCVPHILVVSVFLSSITYVYLKPSAASETIQDMILSSFYTIIPPLLNAMIYSFRNKQVKDAVRKVLTNFVSGKQ
ncbi:olfactory receptor 14C36-like [Manis javanica]|uniref:olfactory receptor 14C36-like n=1 Tax=Manis javanica TaxID=9974 RepID=UPI003C6DAEC8